MTREIANGVTARVVRDTVTLDGEIIEDTFDWYAQDEAGTVWYLGEDTAEFEDGEVATREGSFEAGVDGAQAGVIMPASPEVGMTYRQEYYEGEAEDNGEILELGEQADVPAGDYDDLVQTADTTPLEPDVLEHKYYARGVGLVLVIGVTGGGGREELVGHRRRCERRSARAAGTDAARRGIRVNSGRSRGGGRPRRRSSRWGCSVATQAGCGRGRRWLGRGGRGRAASAARRGGPATSIRVRDPAIARPGGRRRCARGAPPSVLISTRANGAAPDHERPVRRTGRRARSSEPQGSSQGADGFRVSGDESAG